MRAEELGVGEDFAYIVDGRYAAPLKATVLAPATGGFVQVTVHDPDSGTEERRVATRTLWGVWHEPIDPDRVEGGLAARVREARETKNTPPTWATIARERMELVMRQRALADRLGALGIPREHRPYLGNPYSQGWQLVLTNDELEQLLALAESSPRPAVDPTAITSTMETTT